MAANFDVCTPSSSSPAIHHLITIYIRRTAGYTWDRLQNKFTHCKGIRNNTGSRQTTGIQEELDTTCKQNAS